jgi:hypothetical protein
MVLIRVTQEVGWYFFWCQHFQIHNVVNQGRHADKPPAKAFATWRMLARSASFGEFGTIGFFYYSIAWDRELPYPQTIFWASNTGPSTQVRW